MATQLGGPHLQTPETNFDGFSRKGIYLEVTRWCTKSLERKNQVWKTHRDQGRPGAHRVRTPKMALHHWTLAPALLLLESGCSYTVRNEFFLPASWHCLSGFRAPGGACDRLSTNHLVPPYPSGWWGGLLEWEVDPSIRTPTVGAPQADAGCPRELYHFHTLVFPNSLGAQYGQPVSLCFLETHGISRITFLILLPIFLSLP